MAPRLTMTRPGARAASTLAVVLLVSGCTSWRSHSTNPGAYIAARQPERVRVVLDDDTRVEMRHPQLHGDSIVGYVPDEGRLLSLRVADVRELKVASNDWFVIVGVSAGLAWLLFPGLHFFWECSTRGCT